MINNIDLRTTFNKEAKLYDLIRPHYPEKLINSVVKITQLNDQAELLEIGVRTGLAGAYRQFNDLTGSLNKRGSNENY